MIVIIRTDGKDLLSHLFSAANLYYYCLFRHEWTLKDFEIGKPLGEGKFGHVYLARTAKEKRIIALKVIHIKQIEEDQMEHQVNRETDIHIGLV